MARKQKKTTEAAQAPQAEEPSQTPRIENGNEQTSLWYNFLSKVAQGKEKDETYWMRRYVEPEWGGLHGGGGGLEPAGREALYFTYFTLTGDERLKVDRPEHLADVHLEVLKPIVDQLCRNIAKHRKTEPGKNSSGQTNVSEETKGMDSHQQG